MDELNERDKRRKELLELLKAKSIKRSRIRVLLQSIEREFKIIKEEFDDLDYELAMENRTILPSRKTTKPREDKKFTIDEIKSIAIKLGVEITIKEENEK